MMNHPTEQKNSIYTYNTYYYAYTSKLVPRVSTLKRSLVFSLRMSEISLYISCKKKTSHIYLVHTNQENIK